MKDPKETALKILTFSSLFPHAGDPSLGIFVERRLRYLLMSGGIEARVIAPVPYFPFKHELFGSWARYARADRLVIRDGLEISHPRYIAIPKIGMRTAPYALYLGARKTLIALIKQGFTPDIIDAHYFYPDGVAASYLAREFDLPLVITARGSDVTEIPSYAFALTKMRQAASQCHHIITVSRSLKNTLKTIGFDPKKITTIRNGVDTRLFNPEDRDTMRQKLGLSGCVLLVAGWLIPRKRVDRVIEMAASLPHVSLIIAGRGPLEKRLRQQVSMLKISARVNFLGQVPPQKMPAIMAAADILVLASEREGWPNVLLESMACGTSVITTDAGGAREFVSLPGGVIAGTPSVEGLLDAFNRLQKQGIDRQNVRNYALNYSWDDVSSAQKHVLQMAIETKKIQSEMV